MGEEFISTKKAAFKHQRDAALDERLKTPNLWSGRSETEVKIYRCKLTEPNVTLVPAQKVLIAELGQANLVVLLVNQRIGIMDDASSAALRREWQQTVLEVGMVVGTVHDVPRLGTSFTVEV